MSTVVGLLQEEIAPRQARRWDDRGDCRGAISGGIKWRETQAVGFGRRQMVVGVAQVPLEVGRSNESRTLARIAGDRIGRDPFQV